MQHTQSGFVLFSVLVLVFLAISLLLVMIDSAETEFAMTTNFYLQQQLFNKINSNMNLAYQEIHSGFIPCQISATSSYELKHENSLFWNSSLVCQKNDFNYVVEALPINACITIDNIHSSRFYRITGRETDANGSSMLLQAVYSLNSQEQVKCESTIKRISEGQQSWRRL